MKKTQGEILDSILYALKETDINSVEPGSVARTFSDVISEQFYEFYNELDANMLVSFLSTSYGRYLDLIGELLDCKRNSSESDDDYRFRIKEQVYVVAGGNLTSIRLKALSVDGVNDVIVKQFTHGAGSFTLYVLADETKDQVKIIREVQEKVNTAKSMGVYAEVKLPDYTQLEIKARILFKNGITDGEKTSIREEIMKESSAYVKGLNPGSPFLAKEFMERILLIDNKIVDVELMKMTRNKEEIFISNVEVEWDEKIVLTKLEIVS